LTALLERHRADHRGCLIVTDSVFSMDGDLAPLDRLVEIKRRFEAVLLIDEAHATGVMGPGGRGLAERMGLEREIDATVGTLSKAIGALGGFVAGPRVLIDTIRNTGRAYMFTTAPPPALCAAAMKALEIIRDEPHRRERVLRLGDDLRGRLRAAGLNTGDSASQIIPVIIGEAGEALRVSRELLEAGFLVPAIRPPTVPRGTSRLRVSLCAGHEEADLERFAAVLAGIVRR
jgi:8-amino-7-oxononanoate synthase